MRRTQTKTRPEKLPSQQLVAKKAVHDEKGVERLQVLGGAATLKQTKDVNGIEIDRVVLVTETRWFRGETKNGVESEQGCHQNWITEANA